MRTEEQLSALLKSNGIELLQYKAGQGGSALVHRGRVATPHEKIAVAPGLEVAIKEYKDEIVAKKEQLGRIRQEMAIGQTVVHTNVIRIHCLLEDGDGSPLLLMDWVDGTRFDSWCNASEKRRSWEDLRQVGMGLVEGLQALHSRRILHRDVKPANVFVRSSGDPVLMDLGVVEVAADDEHTLHTSVEDFIGSVRYAAPQFIRGEEFDFADDVYALGATLFLAVTGKEVFAAVGRKPLLPHYILTESTRVGELANGLPTQLSVLLEGALHRDRKRRPSLDEVRTFLDVPEGAPYIQRELDARNKEKRGFEVVGIYDQGATVLADMRGAEPSEVRFSVVRELKAIKVPSLGGEVKPEKWIADVELKHVRGGLGHFAVQGKRWEPGKPSSILAFTHPFGGTDGRWVEYDKQTDLIRTGDVIVEPTV